MPFLSLFTNLTEKDKSIAVERLIRESTPRNEFFLMMILSIMMATFGLMLNSVPVIIGSMLIAPLLSPILSLSLGVVMSDGPVMSRSATTIIKSVVISVLFAALVVLFLTPGRSALTSESILQLQPSLIYFAVALISGFVVSFALVKPQMNETLPGVAIAVSLIPPLAAVGIGLAEFNWIIVSNAFVLFLVNTAGIVFASMMNFSLMNFYVKRKVAETTLKKEDKKLEEEKEQAKQIEL